jgi:excisionase family DNA binding protein
VKNVAYAFKLSESFMPQRIGDRVLLSTAEAAKIFGLSRVHIQRLLRLEQLEGMKLGHDWLVFEDSLRAYMSQPRKTGPKPKGKETRGAPDSSVSLSSHTHHNSQSGKS